MPQRRRLRNMPGDELIGDVMEIGTDDVRLRPDRQHIIPDAPNQRGLPSGGDGPERIPGMARDQAQL